MLRSLVAFPRVMTWPWWHCSGIPLSKDPKHAVMTRPTFGYSISDETPGTGIVLLGLCFSDGFSYRNLDERGSAGHLGGLQGGSRAFTGYRDFWAPLPTPGELEVWVAWPAAQIPETRTLLDASGT